jgi:hypothetical protein
MFHTCCIVILTLCVLDAEDRIPQKEDSNDYSPDELGRSDRLLLNDPSVFDRRL